MAQKKAMWTPSLEAGRPARPAFPCAPDAQRYVYFHYRRYCLECGLPFNPPADRSWATLCHGCFLRASGHHIMNTYNWSGVRVRDIGVQQNACVPTSPAQSRCLEGKPPEHKGTRMGLVTRGVFGGSFGSPRARGFPRRPPGALQNEPCETCTSKYNVMP